jgi:hypothetical protein
MSYLLDTNVLARSIEENHSLAYYKPFAPDGAYAR